MEANSFGARDMLTVGEEKYEIYRLDAVEGPRGFPTASRCCWRTCCATRTGAWSPRRR